MTNAELLIRALRAEPIEQAVRKALTDELIENHRYHPAEALKYVARLSQEALDCHALSAAARLVYAREVPGYDPRNDIAATSNGNGLSLLIVVLEHGTSGPRVFVEMMWDDMPNALPWIVGVGAYWVLAHFCTWARANAEVIPDWVASCYPI